MDDVMTTREASELMGLSLSATHNRMVGAGVKPLGRRGRAQTWRRADVERVHEEYTEAPSGWWSAAEIAEVAGMRPGEVRAALGRDGRRMLSAKTHRRCTHWSTRTVRNRVGVDMLTGERIDTAAAHDAPTLTARGAAGVLGMTEQGARALLESEGIAHTIRAGVMQWSLAAVSALADERRRVTEAKARGVLISSSRARAILRVGGLREVDRVMREAGAKSEHDILTNRGVLWRAEDVARVAAQRAEDRTSDGGRLITTREAAELLGLRDLKHARELMREHMVGEHAQHAQRLLWVRADVEQLALSRRVRGGYITTTAAAEILGMSTTVAMEAMSDAWVMSHPYTVGEHARMAWSERDVRQLAAQRAAARQSNTDGEVEVEVVLFIRPAHTVTIEELCASTGLDADSVRRRLRLADITPTATAPDGTEYYEDTEARDTMPARITRTTTTRDAMRSTSAFARRREEAASALTQEPDELDLEFEARREIVRGQLSEEQMLLRYRGMSHRHIRLARKRLRQQKGETT